MTLDYRFSKQYRLLKTEEFSSVFALRKQRSSALLHILRSDNNLLGHARLGLVVGKKVAKRANARNYMKRVIRIVKPPRKLVNNCDNYCCLNNKHGCKIINGADSVLSLCD